MKDILFIQFYGDKFHDGVLILFNGFSDTHKYCKNIGDVIWVDHYKIKTFTFGSNVKTVYISSNLIEHTDASIEWAIKYPQINFIVGGPCISIAFSPLIMLPPNIKFTDGSVEQYFNIPDHSQEWGLDISDIENAKSNKLLTFSYSIMTDCYWSKCIFCNCHYFNNRTRDYIDKKAFDSIDFPGIKQVRFNIPAMSRDNLNNFMSQFYFDPNTRFDFSIRCDKHIYETMDLILNKLNRTTPNLKINFGLEFPSNRILQFINKGVNVEDIFKTVEVLGNHKNINIFSNSIIGWPNLIESDIDELKYFIDNIGNIYLNSIWKLKCYNGTPSHDIFNDGKQTIFENKYFYRGYMPFLSDEAIELNKIAEKI